MTQDAQGALRRIMEQYSRITRFCLICNYVTRIIEPLASRCSKFRFRPLDIGSSTERLNEIAHAENVHVSEDTVKALIHASDGDMRRAITYLQSLARLSTAGDSNASALSVDEVDELAGVVPRRVIVNLACSIGVEPVAAEEETDAPQPKGSPFDRVQAAVKQIAREGYPGIQLVSQLNEYIILHPMVTAHQKTKAALHFGEADKSLIDGGNEELQLLSLCLQLQRDLSEQ